MRPLVLADVVSLVVLAVLAAALPENGGFGWDGRVADFITDAVPISEADVHADPFVAALTIGVSGLAALLAVALLARRRVRAALLVAAGITGAVLLSAIVKSAVERPPIDGEDGSSFPSGTATWSMAVAAAVILVARTRRERIARALAGTPLVLLLGVVIAWEEWHYPSDVLAGWCLAVAWVVTLFLLLRPDADLPGRNINASAATHASARHQPPRTSDG